jgi:AcrR family transcriptional regulator
VRADARRNRERLLQVAEELFTSEGLSVPLDEIARHAGVGPGTVHRHFPTKESLYAAVVVDRVARVIEQAQSLADTPDPGAALLDLLSRMLNEGTASAPLKSALAGTDFDLRTAAPEASGALYDGVAKLLSRAQQAGSIRRDIDTDDVMSLLAGAFAAISHAQANPQRASHLTTVFFDGLRQV